MNKIKILSLLTLILVTNCSVKQLKRKKTVKHRNLSAKIYEDLTVSLTHLMNKRAEKYPEARSLNHSQINQMKTLDVHSSNPIYGFFWDKDNQFKSYYHAPHFNGVYKGPKVIQEIKSRFQPRKKIFGQMDCVLSVKIGMIRYNKVMKWTSFRLAFKSNCMESIFYKYFMIKETFHKLYTLNFQIEGGDLFKVDFYREYKCCDKGDEYLNMYKLRTYYTAKLFRIKDQHKWKIFGKPEKPHDWDEVRRQKLIYGRNLTQTLLRKMNKKYKASQYKVKKDMKFIKKEKQRALALKKIQKRELKKLRKRNLKIAKEKKKLRKDKKNRKLSPEDLELLIPGYKHDPLFSSSNSWNKFDGLQWKLSNHDYQILSPMGTPRWESDVLERLWKTSNPEVNCKNDNVALSITCKF